MEETQRAQLVQQQRLEVCLVFCLSACPACPACPAYPALPCLLCLLCLVLCPALPVLPCPPYIHAIFILMVCLSGYGALND